MIVSITLSVNPEPVGVAPGLAVVEPLTVLPHAPASLQPSAGRLDTPPLASNRQLTLETGKTIFVTGPNGVGKSSLLAEISHEARRNGARVETFFGSREIKFQSDDVDQVGQSLDQLESQLQHSVTRFRHPWGEQHLKSVVRRLVDLQAQATHDIFQAQEDGATFEEARARYPLAINSANGIFEAARLPIQIKLTAGRLRAQRDNVEYGINRLSDGERAALLLVGAVLVQPADSFIFIDEPERHLNPGISGALLAALIRARVDLGFVFASHDLQLLEWLRPEQVIHLRDSSIIRSDPESRRYDMTLLMADDGISEELRSAVLGSRRMLLLVEGETSSEDQALYGHIYPAWNVVARGGWETVVNGVKALHGNQKYHWLHTAGIIDRDGRDAAEQISLSEDHIFCLPVPMIENLFLHHVVLEEMASKIHELKGGMTGAERIAQLKDQLQQILQNCKEDIIVKRLVWEANRRNSGQKVSAKSIRQGQTEIPRIDLSEIKAQLATEFDAAVSAGNPTTMLLEIPVKNSAIPNRVARHLGFDDFKDYTRAVLRQIEIGSHAGKTILEILRAIMPTLD